MEPRMEVGLEASELQEIEAMEAGQVAMEAILTKDELLKILDDVVKDMVEAEVSRRLSGMESGEQSHGMVPVVTPAVNEAFELTQSERCALFQEHLFFVKSIIDHLLDEFAPHVFQKLDMLLNMTPGNATNEEGIGSGMLFWASTAFVTWVFLILAFLIVIFLTIIFVMIVLSITPFWALGRGFFRLLHGFKLVKQWIYSSG